MSLDTVMDSSAGSQSDRSSNVSPSPPPPPPLPLPTSRPPMTPPISSPNHHITRQSPLTMAASMNHQLSPPQVSTPNSIATMAHRYAGLPPPSLGLLNSLNSMVHHSPLDLMAVAHHHSQPPRSYNSPPPISSSDPTANECKLVDYRGQKVAAFMIQGDTMLCLPQAFELFLKHLVGGLHTVYTKLKRLDIVPLVCNVEQVRILRGLGAIQPGVNRCKLLACKDFDILYRDCTTARCLMTHKTAGPDSSRPGRPPKRASVGLSLAASHLSHQLKKHRLENGGSDYGDYPNGHLQNDVPRLEKSPLLANGYHHPPTQLSQLQFLQQMNQSAQSGGTPPGVLPPHSGLSRHDAAALMKHHGNLPNIEALARSGIWENCRAAYEDIVKHLERLREERGEAERALTLDQKARDLSSHNGSSNGHSPVLNLSKGGGDHSGSEAGHTGPEDEGDEEENVTDVDDEMEEKHHPELSDIGNDIDGSRSRKGSVSPHHPHALNYSALAGSISPTSVLPNVDPSSVSSTETLLRNIQGLLKVAADNARQQERQINYEKDPFGLVGSALSSLVLIYQG
ncbi:hypothetical protein M8J75_001584 [Diaphorina citri]|nr:hypothetical protein M8J75_001584 [Diaphorina citri]KAI5751912.1 hypothetical protein M8J77_012011 [Diaphorina citri]